MIRPCDTCGGSGDLGAYPDILAEPCPRCEDRPRLVCPNAIVPGPEGGRMHPFPTCDICQVSEYYLLGRFRPDPDTVIRWCFHHDSKGHGDESCDVWRLLVALRSTGGMPVDGPRDCDIGWVARPERLEVSDD